MKRIIGMKKLLELIQKNVIEIYVMPCTAEGHVRVRITPHSDYHIVDLAKRHFEVDVPMSEDFETAVLSAIRNQAERELKIAKGDVKHCAFVVGTIRDTIRMIDGKEPVRKVSVKKDDVLEVLLRVGNPTTVERVRIRAPRGTDRGVLGRANLGGSVDEVPIIHSGPLVLDSARTLRTDIPPEDQD
jgi:hypothetical protein